MQRVKLYMSSGQIVEFDCKSFSTSKNGFGNTTQIEWKSDFDSGNDHLHMVKLDEVIAITYQEVTAQD